MKKKIIKIERFYEDGSSDFVVNEYLENFQTNLNIADGFAISRSYIQYKPVHWTNVPAEEKFNRSIASVEKEIDDRQNTYIRAFNTIKQDIEEFDNKISEVDMCEAEHEDALDLCELYHQMRIGKYNPEL